MSTKFSNAAEFKKFLEKNRLEPIGSLLDELIAEKREVSIISILEDEEIAAEIDIVLISEPPYAYITGADGEPIGCIKLRALS